jgi:hypothetical protein
MHGRAVGGMFAEGGAGLAARRLAAHSSKQGWVLTQAVCLQGWHVQCVLRMLCCAVHAGPFAAGCPLRRLVLLLLLLLVLAADQERASRGRESWSVGRLPAGVAPQLSLD